MKQILEEIKMHLDPLEIKTILSLAEAPESTSALELHEEYPKKVIVKAGLNLINDLIDDYFITKHVDNTQPLPFDDNMMDAIILLGGLCYCFDNKPCGGFDNANEFFSEIFRVLNKNNNSAFCYLNGAGVSPDTIIDRLDLWDGILTELSSLHNFLFERHIVHESFFGYKIYRR